MNDVKILVEGVALTFICLVAAPIVVWKAIIEAVIAFI